MQSLAAQLRELAERVPTPTRVAPSERTVAKHCVSDLKSARNRRRGSLASREGLSFERTATGIARKQASALEGLLGGGAPRVSGQKDGKLTVQRVPSAAGRSARSRPVDHSIHGAANVLTYVRGRPNRPRPVSRAQDAEPIVAGATLRPLATRPLIMTPRRASARQQRADRPGSLKQRPRAGGRVRPLPVAASAPTHQSRVSPLAVAPSKPASVKAARKAKAKADAVVDLTAESDDEDVTPVTPAPEPLDHMQPVVGFGISNGVEFHQLIVTVTVIGDCVKFAADKCTDMVWKPEKLYWYPKRGKGRSPFLLLVTGDSQDEWGIPGGPFRNERGTVFVFIPRAQCSAFEAWCAAFSPVIPGAAFDMASKTHKKFVTEFTTQFWRALAHASTSVADDVAAAQAAQATPIAPVRRRITRSATRKRRQGASPIIAFDDDDDVTNGTVLFEYPSARVPTPNASKAQAQAEAQAESKAAAEVKPADGDSDGDGQPASSRNGNPASASSGDGAGSGDGDQIGANSGKTARSSPGKSGDAGVVDSPQPPQAGAGAAEASTELVLRGIKGAVSITKGDRARLNAGELLNDSIIDCYLKYVHLRLLDETEREQVHIFSTLFYERLTDGKGRNVTGRQDAGYANVKAWTSRGDVFKKKYLLIPINGGLHWSLAIVMNPSQLKTAPSSTQHQLRMASTSGGASTRTRSARSQQPPRNFGPDTTCILFFDSLNMHDRDKICKNIRGYLTRELQRVDVRRKVTEANMPVFAPEAPKQSNSVDCGVFVLMYAKEFLLTWAFPTDECPRHTFGKRWFVKKAIAKLRRHIQEQFTQWCSKPGALLRASQPVTKAEADERKLRQPAEPIPSDTPIVQDSDSDGDSNLVSDESDAAMAPGARAMPPSSRGRQGAPGGAAPTPAPARTGVMATVREIGSAVVQRAASLFLWAATPVEAVPRDAGATTATSVVDSNPRAAHLRTGAACSIMESFSQNSSDDLASSQPAAVPPSAHTRGKITYQRKRVGPPQLTHAQRSKQFHQDALGLGKYETESDSDGSGSGSDDGSGSGSDSGSDLRGGGSQGTPTPGCGVDTVGVGKEGSKRPRSDSPGSESCGTAGSKSGDSDRGQDVQQRSPKRQRSSSP